MALGRSIAPARAGPEAAQGKTPRDYFLRRRGVRTCLRAAFGSSETLVSPTRRAGAGRPGRPRRDLWRLVAVAGADATIQMRRLQRLHGRRRRPGDVRRYRARLSAGALEPTPRRYARPLVAHPAPLHDLH